jgi:hypothetical protein
MHLITFLDFMHNFFHDHHVFDINLQLSRRTCIFGPVTFKAVDM